MQAQLQNVEGVYFMVTSWEVRFMKLWKIGQNYSSEKMSLETYTPVKSLHIDLNIDLGDIKALVLLITADCIINEGRFY